MRQELFSWLADLQHGKFASGAFLCAGIKSHSSLHKEVKLIVVTTFISVLLIYVPQYNV